MSQSTSRASGFVAAAILAISVCSTVGLFAVSDVLHLRSPHPALSEAFGWASFVVVLAFVSLPSWNLGRATAVTAVNLPWMCLLVLASVPAGYAVVHFGPARFNSDRSGAVVTMALASLAYSAGVAGLIGARRGPATPPALAFGLCGGFVFVVISVVAS